MVMPRCLSQHRNWRAFPLHDHLFIPHYLPHPIILHTYFYSLDSRLGDLGHLGLGDGRLVLVQWVQLKNEKRQQRRSFVIRCNYYISNHSTTTTTAVVQSIIPCGLQALFIICKTFILDMFVVKLIVVVGLPLIQVICFDRIIKTK